MMMARSGENIEISGDEPYVWQLVFQGVFYDLAFRTMEGNSVILSKEFTDGRFPGTVNANLMFLGRPLRLRKSARFVRLFWISHYDVDHQDSKYT